jgi:hypothetical protein
VRIVLVASDSHLGDDNVEDNYLVQAYLVVDMVERLEAEEDTMKLVVDNRLVLDSTMCLGVVVAAAEMVVKTVEHCSLFD